MSLLLLLAALLFSPGPARAADGPTVRLYVAPSGDDRADGRSPRRALRTLARAQEAVRALRRERPEAAVVVAFRGGVYPVAEPLVFRPEDSGTAAAPVRYEAYPGETPIFSGGRRITGWKAGPGGLWTADLPEVRAGAWKFRQLYADGVRRRRSRLPDAGFYRVAGFPDGGREAHYHTDSGRFEYAPGDINPGWKNLDDAEVIVYHFWTDSHLPIAAIDTAARIVSFKHKAGKVFTDDFTPQGARYVVDNVFEGLNEPGEWYLDRKAGVLYYLPMPGETPETTEIVAPALPEFLRFEGDPAGRAYTEHLAFVGLSFLYTNWDLPPGDSNDRQGSAGVPAAVTLRGSRHVRFEGCAFRNLGTFAVEVGEGSAYLDFSANTFAYLAAGALRIGGGDEAAPPLLRTGYNRIADNTIHHYGEVFPSAVGILLTHTFGNTVAHNHIHHGYYTGISVGWEWGYQRSISRDNLIAYNHIHDIGQGLLSDMGGIYTLGVSPGTVLRGNLIHHIDANHYGGWGIYNDEGSTHLLIEDNVVHHTKYAPYNIHFAREITVRNNIFALGAIDQLSRSRVEPHQSLYFENNIVYWKEGDLLRGDWKDKEYTFYFHPKNASGTRAETATFTMDWNLYFNPTLDSAAVRFGEETPAQWHARGKDRHSVYADPLFRDPEAGDFEMPPGAPAYALGFRPIDLRRVGPRPPAERLAGNP